MRLTFLGNGIMAEAMISRLLKLDYKIEVFGRDEKKLSDFREKFDKKIETFTYKNDTDISDKTVILCVKPHALQQISHFFKGEAKLIVSVLAGTSIETLKKEINAKSYVRAMPNIAAFYGKSMTTITGDKTSKDEVLKILNSIGKTLWVESEKELDIATVLAGSSPAFLALVAESLIDGAVKEGLKRADAFTLAKGLFEGFAELLENYPHPAFIKDAVMSPNGVTAKGYATLEDYKVRSAFMKIYQKNI
ncbi:MAG: pyrroline-5-carboxylate reductase [Campylobacteraceae bacterium]|jgi:pyrroline-5-carboxylate reductase|nr:pyrroline-5-carboxylate reductase [Campylobacteraceae bacterium]